MLLPTFVKKVVSSASVPLMSSAAVTEIVPVVLPTPIPLIALISPASTDASEIVTA